MRTRPRFRTVALGLAIAAFGLGGAPASAQTDAYDLGWEHGCEVGNARQVGGYLERDPTDRGRLRTDAEYRRGWNDGFRFCGYTGSM